MKLKELIYGVATWVPGVKLLRAKGTGGTDSARYCYSVWLRHLVMAKKNGLNPFPKIVAELGPGDSLGIGLAALISGSDKYFAFDVVEHASVARNKKVFDELVALFNNRAPIPADDEFPMVKPHLESYDFPSDILDEDRLAYALEESRLEHIRKSVGSSHREGSLIQYKVPWHEKSMIEKEFVDMIYSQAVLEHVDDLTGAYRAMYSWLKSTGYMSHQIDFKCHGTADEWNGHWAYSDFMWKLIKGKRPFLLNREPHATHLASLTEVGFELVCDIRMTSESQITRNELAAKFKSISDDDLRTSGAFIQAVKVTKGGARQSE